MDKRLLLSLLLGLASHLLTAQCASGDCQNGWGTFLFPDGSKYVGEFKDGEVHGVGVCYFPDGRQYSGEWDHRFPHGSGTLTMTDGAIYRGRWEKGRYLTEDEAEGEVVVQSLTDDGAALQSGCVSGDCRNGKGIFTYPDGSKYQGEFRNGKLDGWGAWFYPNGDRYVGAFRENLKHGKGTLYREDGSKVAGIWEEGEFARSNLAEEQIREGCISGDCAEGKGTYVFKNAEASYTGTFFNGFPHGRGVCLYANGDRYEGEWASGKFNGYGVLHQRNGTEVKGYWKDGNYLGWFSKLLDEEEEKGEGEPGFEKLKPSVSGSKVWAVVVGVAAYRHMPALRYTDDDAYRIFAFLKSPEGGAIPDERMRILVDEDATRENIMKTMEDVFFKAGENDLVIMYFSGHGLKGAFLPIDYDGYNHKLYHEEINEILDRSKAKFKLFIADACHSGSLLARKGEGESEASYFVDFYHSLAQTEPGMALIMSSKSDETSLESSGLRQGVFTHFLIRGMKGEADLDRDYKVTLYELYDFIYQGVRQYTGMRQSPMIKGTYNGNMVVSLVR
jgi:hypothetical protein